MCHLHPFGFIADHRSSNTSVTSSGNIDLSEHDYEIFDNTGRSRALRSEWSLVASFGCRNVAMPFVIVNRSKLPNSTP